MQAENIPAAAAGGQGSRGLLVGDSSPAMGMAGGGRHPEMVGMGCSGDTMPETTLLVSGHKIGIWEMEKGEKRSITRQVETANPSCLNWTVQ